MRTTTKKRIQFFALAFVSYYTSSTLMPESMPSLTLGSDTLQNLLESFSANPQIWLGLAAATVLIFVVVPLFYIAWMIKPSNQPRWKILLVLSLSCLVARYQYPPEIAQYFDFIAWLRYPIIAVVLVFELYLIGSVIKSLWQARTLAGDPRINVLKQYQDQEKKREIGLVFAFEPASWYYAIPRFTRKHPLAIGHLQLLSAKAWHLALVLLSLVAITFASYVLLLDWSELGAVIVSTLWAYCLILVIANYRVSKHFSLYLQDGQLIINNAWWGFIAIDINNIAECKIGEWNKQENEETLTFGRGDTANLEIKFKTSETYYSAMAQFSDEADGVFLNVENAELCSAKIREVIDLA